ncbi:MAG: DUF721 domain-containing protein [Acidimicrobiia bacterium]|nr:DUF721 domain-containing protein [bacterium]MXZ69188.1 DUF721 domain-containing protein [Acidimicrobiia bacterium]MYB45209.1 DUF721 domain-containing protein [Acidimicrobiia bacterium]
MTERWSPDRVEEALASFDGTESRALRMLWEIQQLERGHQRRTEEQDGEMVSFGDMIQSILAGLGVADLDRVRELDERWEEVAGPQWGSNSVPVVVTNGELLVEASDPRLVRMLRHDAEPLVLRIADRFGRSFVTSVRVVGPPWRRGW